MQSKLILILHAFAILSGTARSDNLFQLDFSTGAGTQAGWEAIGGTGSPSGTFSGYTGLSDGNITVSLANIAFDRLYKNGTTGAPDDFPGTDLDAMYSDLLFRNNDAATVDVSISGLRAGTYQVTTHHLHSPNTPSQFDLRVQDADSLSLGQLVGNFAMGLGNTSSFNPTVITFEVVSNGTDDIILQMDATFIGSGGNTGGWFGFNGLEIIPAPAATFQLAITETSPPATGYDFQWNSQEGKVYDLLTSTDLATPTIEWPVYNDGETLYEAIPSAGETTTLTAVPSANIRRFFAVREYDAPPPPVVSELSSVWGSGTTITLIFTEELDAALATDPFNYTVQLEGGGMITVSDASLSGDGKTVTLTLGSALGIDSAYNVGMSNLTSIDGTPLGGSTIAQFQTWDNDPNGIKVFIVAGQSNMVGYGHSETGNGGAVGAIGSLRYLAMHDDDPEYSYYDYTSLLVNPAEPENSAWKTRSDVQVWWRDGGTDLGGTVRKGDLGPPFFGIDTAKFGPEYAFGQVLGDFYASDDVLIIKAAWGGKSLAVDFRPPSAVARVPGTQIGPFYQGIFDNVRDVLTNLGTEFPQWSGTGYQIVGFGWHQGWNDRVNQAYNDEYEANMVNFISDVRAELGNSTLPFVIATTGMNGPTETNPRALSLMDAQLAMQNFTKYPAHDGNVAVRDTRDFWRDASVSPSATQGYHWNQNAETYFLIGKSMGDLMVDLLTP